jgi:hypothetical protein
MSIITCIILIQVNSTQYKIKMEAHEVLSTNLNGSQIKLCLVNKREIKYLTYKSIITNICIIYNLPFPYHHNNNCNNNQHMVNIILFVTSNNISFEIVIKLHNYQFIEYKHQVNLSF